MRASNPYFLIWILCALCLSSSLSSEFTPDDNFLIDCGSSSNSTVEGRLFLSDDSNPNGKSLSTTSNVSSSSPLYLFSPLFRTAKVFETTSQYNFKIKKQGRHWIRLYFYPFVSGNFSLSLAKFSVSAQNITLLKEFQIDSGSVIKEYSLNVTSSNLVLTFTPMVNSFAFINALEVVSVPNELIPSTITSVEKVKISLENRVLETVARVNMGNETVLPNDDILSRLWVADGPFLMHNDQVVVGKFVSNLTKVNMTRGSEIEAPRFVYGTATRLGADVDANANVNVSWSFDIDLGYEYLIRYHFCDIIDLFLGPISFNVYVNSWKVKDHLDLSSLTSHIPGAPYVLDTIASPIDSSKFKISVGPSNFHEYSAAILNGLEIMKISDSRRSLDEPSGLHSKKGSNVKVGLIAGLVAGLLVLVVLATLVIVLCRRRRSALVRHLKEEENFGANGRESNYIIGSVAFSNSKISYRYPLAAIQEATGHFSESLVIGLGGFGKVYKGMLRDNTEVAVKRGTSKSQQGLAEFQTEIEMLSQFRHRHLVSLIGYCDEQNEMIIIYEYMEKGTLKDHLYGSELPSLSWKQRLDICIGSARGLHYLHTGSTKAIIHRDVKTANILLDQNNDNVDSDTMFGGFLGGNDNPFGVNFGLGNLPDRFDEHYRVYPVSFCDKSHLEDGDKILMPPSALDTLARLHIEYPMLFKVVNEAANRHSHCGVLEFSAPEGTCYMPYWMMQNLFVSEGDIINIQNVSLPKATFVKIRPQSQDFLDISNPRAVLEASLRKFSCMTIGDTICLQYNNKNFLLDVREVKPAPAACIIETDCEVDFEAPADYVPPPPKPSSAVAAPPVPSDIPYGGVPTVKSSEVAAAPQRTLGSGLRLKKGGDAASTDLEAMRAARMRKYEAFHGTGRSLSGTSSSFSSLGSSGTRLGGSARTLASASTASSGTTEEEEKNQEPAESSKPGFVAFQGSGRRLR